MSIHYGTVRPGVFEFYKYDQGDPQEVLDRLNVGLSPTYELGPDGYTIVYVVNGDPYLQPGDYYTGIGTITNPWSQFQRVETQSTLYRYNITEA